MSNHSEQAAQLFFSEKLKIGLAVGAVLVGVVGFFVLPDQPFIRPAALVVGLFIAALLFYTAAAGKRLLVFVKEAIRETKKVVWPTRKEATQITMIVFVFVFIMALFLWGTDKLLEFLLYDVILSWKK